MATYKEISIDEVLARTKIQMRVANTTEHDDFFALMILEATRHLGSLSLFKKKQTNLTIIDNKSELPKDFYRLLGIRASGQGSNNPFVNGGNCITQLYVDNKFLNDCGCSSGIANTVDFNLGFQIQNGFVFWNSGIGADTATLAYLAMNTGDDGKLLIYEDYERAVSSYACYMFCLSYPDLYKESTTDRYKREWMAQKSWVRGNDAASDFQKNKREISAIFNSLIASQIYNY